MEAPNEKRLQDIQMADLGTARREYLSTVDKPNRFRNIGLSQIEKARLSNSDNSVRRLAQINEPKISAWSNFHKNSGDTGDLETLDTMMDGQTHRAQLSAIIRESGGQAYADSTTTKDNFIQVTERSTPTRGRGGSFSGRGGHIPSAAVHMYPPGGIKHQGSSTLSFDTRQTRHLDPALDPEREHAKNKKGQGALPQHPVKSTKPMKPSLKSRRPVPVQENYEALLSAPENFLAAVRNIRPSTTNPLKEGAASVKASTGVSDNAEAGGPAQPKGGTDAPPMDKIASEPNIKPTPVVKLPASPTISASPQPQAPVVVSGPGKSVIIQAKEPRRDDAIERSRGNKIFASNLPRPPMPAKGAATVETSELSKTKLTEMDDLLLDFGSSTSVAMAGDRQNMQTAQKQKDVTTSSPGIMDLIGLDYQQASRTSLIKTTGPPSQSSVVGNVPSAHAQKAASSSSSKIAPLLNEEIIAGYLHELALINDAIAASSVTSSHAKQLNERKQQLERIISQITKAKLAEKASHIQMDDLVSATGSLNISHGEGRAASQSRSRTAQQAQTTMRRHAADEGRKATLAAGQESTLREAVTAPPFVPRSGDRVGQFPTVRTPAAASILQRVVPTDPDVESTSILFGDHLLPGRSGGARSSSVSSDTRSSLKSRADTPTGSGSKKPHIGLEASMHAFPLGEREISTPQQVTTVSAPFRTPAFHDTSNILPKKDPNTPWPAPTHGQQWMHHPQAFAIAIPAQENVAIRPPHVLQQSPSKARTGNDKGLYASKHAIPADDQTPPR
ncbi:hypothetical protein Egran_05380 [Elaphomyces granulatus]|uniref:Uncharacterized protein n=1 Tax=Elaphomyces granulatus TaxID=519963 RepID=A0A232LRS0_9EURO|nr:hypothetical protein Egran_05380 [Elaphomyces granulatus]